MDDGISRVVEISGKYLRRQVSSTFHGRDIMAPAVSDILSRGFDGLIKADGKGIERLELAFTEAGPLIVKIDHFGNIVTNIPCGIFGEKNRMKCVVCGERFDLEVFNTYEAGGKIPFFICGSKKTMEISLKNGSAYRYLCDRYEIGGLSAGERIEIFD